MQNELNNLLDEIEIIISKIALSGSNNLEFSYTEKSELIKLFHNKIKQAKSIKNKQIVRLAS